MSFVNVIKKLNLYGRMAYGIKCCIALCKKKNIEYSSLNFILERLCEFTNTDDLSDWEEQTISLLPACIFEAIDEYGNSECRETRCHAFEIIENIQFCKLAKECSLVSKTCRSIKEQEAFDIYKGVDDDILAIIDNLYDIGSSELYGRPNDLKESEDLLLNIIKILNNNGVKLPEIGEVEKHILKNPIRDMDYFGEKFNCNYLIN